MTGACLNCGGPLPKGSTVRRKYCSVQCRKQYHRHQKKPLIRQQAKVPPSNGTGDAELDAILFMKLEATLRNTLLKELLDKRREEGRRDALEDTEKWKEDRTLDDATAKKAARILAQDYDPS